MLLFYLVIALGISRNVNSQLIPQSRIVFPDTDDFEVECTMPDGSEGMCRNIKYCPTALTDRKEPKTCYFQQFEHFVCCNENSIVKLSNRPSSKTCVEAYPFKNEITGGERTQPNEFPYMVALGWESVLLDAYDYKCGAVLITSDYAMTAAHCAYVSGMAPTVALVGGGTLTDATVTTHNISKITIHPDYKKEMSYNDIALIKLEKPTVGILPACLWNTYALETLNLIAIGYGRTQFAGRSSDELLKADLLAIPNKECQPSYEKDEEVPNGILESQICAKDPQWKRDTCQGDSGGPLIMRLCKGKRCVPYTVGITSFGLGCAQSLPGVYTRVSEYLDWIESIVWPAKK